MTKTFEKLVQFKAQNQSAAEGRQAFQEKVTAAEKALDAEKVKLDELVHVELATKTDKSAEKKAARKTIAEREKDVEYAKSELATANSFLSAKSKEIRLIDVVEAYQKEYAPAVKGEHLPELQKRYKEGEALMLSAIEDFYKLRAEYAEIVEEVKPLSEAARSRGETAVLNYVSNPFQHVDEIGFKESELSRKLNEVKK